MINALKHFYQENLDNNQRINSNKNKVTYEKDFFIQNFMNKLIIQKKMIGKLYEEGFLICKDDLLNGNITKNDEDLLRQLIILKENNCIVLNMEIFLLKPYQEFLSFSKKIDLIQSYLLSNINQKFKGFVLYSYLDQIMAKYQIYLPSADHLGKWTEEKQNLLISKIEQIHNTMEEEIMSYRNKLFSALDLDQQSIETHFNEHYSLYEQYMNDDQNIEIDTTQKYQCVKARECETFQEQIQIDGGEQKKIQSLSETGKEIVQNCDNRILKKLNFKVKIYCIQVLIDPMNQTNQNNLRQVLEGELLQEFCRDHNSIENQIQIEDTEETQLSVYIPQTDPRYKNVLQEELPEIDISIIKRLFILKDVMLTLRENQNLLKQPNFKGKLSIVKMIRFCNILGARPILIMQQKDKKSIDIKLYRQNNDQVIQNLIYVLFFKDRYNDDEIKPIDALCGEFFIGLCNSELQNFPDIDKILLKLEKLILLVKQIYCVPL